MEFIVEGLQKNDLRQFVGGQRCDNNCVKYTCTPFHTGCRAYCGGVACDPHSCSDFGW